MLASAKQTKPFSQQRLGIMSSVDKAEKTRGLCVIALGCPRPPWMTLPGPLLRWTLRFTCYVRSDALVTFVASCY